MVRKTKQAANAARMVMRKSECGMKTQRGSEDQKAESREKQLQWYEHPRLRKFDVLTVGFELLQKKGGQ
jgi:hypothetical protein